MPEQSTSIAPGIQRRAILKTAVWSVPVVTAAIAAPLAAASTAIDLVLTTQPVGEGITGTSPSGLSTYQLSWTSRYDASTTGPDAAPAGASIALSFDARVFSASNASIGGVSLAEASSSTAGDVTTAIFTVPVAIPASGASISITIGFVGIGTSPAWYADVHPIAISLRAPAGYTDPNPANNTHSFSAVYS